MRVWTCIKAQLANLIAAVWNNALEGERQTASMLSKPTEAFRMHTRTSANRTLSKTLASLTRQHKDEDAENRILEGCHGKVGWEKNRERYLVCAFLSWKNSLPLFIRSALRPPSYYALNTSDTRVYRTITWNVVTTTLTGFLALNVNHKDFWFRDAFFLFSPCSF